MRYSQQGASEREGGTNLIHCSEYVIKILITHSHYMSSIGSPRASSADATELKLSVICLLTSIRPTLYNSKIFASGIGSHYVTKAAGLI